LSEKSLSSKLASVALATSLIVTPVGAVNALENPSADDNNVTTSINSMSAIEARGWKNAKALSENVKKYALKGQYLPLPRPMITDQRFGIITVLSLGLRAKNDVENGHVRTYIGVVVAPGTSGLAFPTTFGGSLEPKEWLDKGTRRAAEIQVKAHEAMQDFAKYGGVINRIAVIEHNQDDIKFGVPMKDAIVIAMGDHPIEIFTSWEDARDALEVMWYSNMHITSDAEYIQRIRSERVTNKDQEGNASASGVPEISVL